MISSVIGADLLQRMTGEMRGVVFADEARKGFFLLGDIGGERPLGELEALFGSSARTPPLATTASRTDSASAVIGTAFHATPR